MWERIKAEGNESIASKALAWLLCAVRPLSPQEIIQAVAVELGSTAFQQRMYPVAYNCSLWQLCLFGYKAECSTIRTLLCPGIPEGA